MSKVVRTVKNVTKGYSSVQVKVRNATSNDPWGPTGQEMSEIAQMTFNGSNDFYEIMDMLDKRLNDKGKNWRHVLKSLKVLDYCLHEGSELVVTWARKNIFVIKTLREFQHMEDDSRDVGQNVRVSAKELTALIMDEERLRSERADRRQWKSRVTGINEHGPEDHGESSSHAPPRRGSRRKHNDEDENDLEMRLALEASKNEMEEDKKKRESRGGGHDDDDDLAKAIRLSKEEEELRRRELEDQNAASLFDDAPIQTQQPQMTGWNQGYQQGGAVDLFGNPVYPQQMQNTGFLDNAYSQFPQQTGYQDGYQQQQPQQQHFDPFGQQQQFLQPQQTIQPQQTAFNMSNPYAQNDYSNAMQQQQQQPQDLGPASGSNNPWAQQNPSELRPLATGSNNPFATKVAQPPPRATSQPTLSSLAEQRVANQFNQRPQPTANNPILNYSAPQQPQPQAQTQPQPQMHPMQQQQQQPSKPMNPQHERLNQLLASGEGMDTFGNTGEMRIPAQHTAPGTFVNSAGQNLNRLHSAQTGNNPFFKPAQTGPVMGGFNQGGGNPFGAQQQQQNQGSSLIDL